MNVLQDGIHGDARQVASPNFDGRPQGLHVELLVIHGITVPAGQMGGDGIEQLFTNNSQLPQLRNLRVSAHFLVRRDGELVQFVNCDRRAWHAGQSRWAGRNSCNDFSIGVELEGTDDQPYSDAQYERLADLVRDLREAYPSLQAIAGHCHIAPDRKTDPGRAFDWQRLFVAVGTMLDGRQPKGDA